MDSSPIEEIKSKLDITEVVADYVKLLPAGSNNMKAPCPFHKEKIPSFFVSREKQIWKCFGCNRGGNIFNFIMEIEGIDFPQALRILAKKAGIELRASGDYHLTSKRTKILDICREAAGFFYWFLLNSSQAEEARNYLEKRKIIKQVIQEWQIGYAANDWRILYQNLTKKGYRNEDILSAGLIISRTDVKIGINNRNIRGNPRQQIRDDSRYYDRFRGRIMFPINDAFGNVVAFTGRILPSLEKEETPKYINSPETPIYSKSRILFGLDKAKLEIKKRNYTILVEGNTDVISAHQAGTKNTVAVSGTALTLEQIKILKRYSPNLILAFDIDSSGQASTKRGIDIALSEEMNLKVLTLPFGKDPDECIKKDKKLWLKAIKNSQLIMDYYFASAFDNFDSTNISDKKRVAKDLLPVISKIGNLIERDFWLKKLAEKAIISLEVLREQLKRTNQKHKDEEEVEPFPKEHHNLIQERFIGLLLKFPEQISSFYEELSEDLFDDEKLKKVLREIKKRFSLVSLENGKVDFDQLAASVDNDEVREHLKFLILTIEKESLPSDKKTIDRELEFLFKRIKKFFLNKRLSELEGELLSAEKEKNNEKLKELSQEIIIIMQELKKYS